MVLGCSSANTWWIANENGQLKIFSILRNGRCHIYNIDIWRGALSYWLNCFAARSKDWFCCSINGLIYLSIYLSLLISLESIHSLLVSFLMYTLLQPIVQETPPCGKVFRHFAKGLLPLWHQICLSGPFNSTGVPLRVHRLLIKFRYPENISSFDIAFFNGNVKFCKYSIFNGHLFRVLIYASFAFFSSCSNH